MFHNNIAGGQVYTHNIRMLLQNLHRSIFYSGVISISILFIICYFFKPPTFDLAAAISYKKASYLEYWSHILKPSRDLLNRNHNFVSRIHAVTDSGIYKKDMRTKDIIHHSYFKKNAEKFTEYFEYNSKIFLGILIVVFLLIQIIWTYIGKNIRTKQLISGHTVKTAKEVIQFLKKQKLASDFTIASIPLVKNTETRHILITGSTGSGKTNCLHDLLPQIRKEKQAAIIVDTEGDILSRYYRPGIDIIINPFDKRTHEWDLFRELNSKKSIKQLASSIFAGNSPDSNFDQKWDNWARIFFIGCLEYLTKNKNYSCKKLFGLLHTTPIEELANLLKGTSASSILTSKSDNNQAPHNIRINAIEATEWMEYLNDANDDNCKSFSFKEWFKSFKAQNSIDQWIFIACDGPDTKILVPYFRTLMDVAFNSLIECGINLDRRVWFIFDELAKLKYIPALQENITLLRKYGGCIVAATQSLNQIIAHYGRTIGATMLGQFNTNVVFRINEIEEARTVIKRIGEIEYVMHQKNTSYGASEFRDGISYGEQERKKEVINVSDLSGLKEREAFIFLPMSEVAISKTQFDIAAKPSIIQQSFMPKPQVKSIINQDEHEQT